MIGVDLARGRMATRLGDSLLEAVRVGGEPLLGLADRQPRFVAESIDRGLRLTPVNAGAAQFVSNRGRAAALDRLMSATTDELPALRDALVGVTFADSPAGAVANKLVSRLVTDPDHMTGQNAAAINRKAADLLAVAPRQKARHSRGIVDLGHTTTRAMQRLLDGEHPRQGNWKTLATWLHESEHAATQPHYVPWAIRGPLGWIEEGSAELVTRWPGRLEALAARAGTEAAAGARTTYETETRIVRALAELGGVDTDAASELDAARALLRAPRIDARPGAIADAIASARQLDRPARDRLETALREAGADFGSSSNPAIRERLPAFLPVARARVAETIGGDDPELHERLVRRTARRMVERELLRERLTAILSDLATPTGRSRS